MKNISIVCFAALLFFASCKSNEEPVEQKSSPILEGPWRGILTLNDSTGLILPFNFDVSFPHDTLLITIKNAEEKLIVDEINVIQDSVFIRMPFFDSEFRCKFNGDSLLEGVWINHAREEKNIIPFAAIYGETHRFDNPEFDENNDFSGKWKCVFGPNLPDSSMAIGIFKIEGNRATGTFLTETGDYRYLEGSVFGKYMMLSCFDGSHAFVFHAEMLEDGGIWGEFYSGIHFHQTWLGYRDENFQLRAANSLTFMKDSTAAFAFSFKDPKGNEVSYSDERFRNKVTLVQILGTWCPNCMDETFFLADFHKQYRDKGVEVVGLSFEKARDFARSAVNVDRLKQRTGAEYDILITGVMPKNADQALPMLNHVMSFPTTIILDKKGKVRQILTGYYGPATGAKHREFVNQLSEITQSLLNE